MANVMDLVKLKNNPSRNGFDLSRKVAFSAKISELTPVECIECIPGDKFKVQKQHFTRTLPVNTAAYTRIREYYDWFFVPTNLLWNKFNTFVTQMDDNNMKANSISQSATTGVQHPYFTSNQITTFIRNCADNNRTNFFGYQRAPLTAKLMDYLGYGRFYDVAGQTNETNDQINNYVANPFPLLAYQKIYQDYFRNSQWENAYAPACNIDYMNNANSMQIPVDQIDYDAEGMFDMRYANWNKDFFMGVLPNAQYGSEAEVDLSSIGSASIQIRSNAAAGGDAAFISTTQGQFLASVVDNNPTLTLSKSSIQNILNSSQFSILALRQAEAAQKWREITQSAQQDYKSQIEAHFGVSVSDAYSDRCKFIDGQVSVLDIDEVVNNNLADESYKANIGGKGVGKGDGFFEFETKVHGYLMCIYHAQPVLDYQITGIKKRNLKSYVTDYAIPEYDKTGMIKIPFIELTNSYLPTSGAQLTDNDFVGFAPQYYDYKTQYDEVKGAFVNGGYHNWVAPFADSYLDKYLTAAYEAFGSYDIEYHFFKIDPAVLNPIFVNQITAGEANASYTETDQLLINCSMDIKAVRNLDRNGLPY